MTETATRTATIRVNGREAPLVVSTVGELLREHGLDPDGRGFAVAVNGAVAPRSQWRSMRLRAGDLVEIVQAKQGG